LNAIPATNNSVQQSYLASGVAGTGPAFSAVFSSGTQTLSVNTNTKIQFTSEEFDTANCFDSTTNYRFTPNVAGYYHISSSVQYGGSPTTPTTSFVMIYKNGTEFKRTYVTSYPSDINISALVYLNGTTDYVEIYGYVGAASGSASVNTGVAITYFQGFLARAA